MNHRFRLIKTLLQYTPRSHVDYGDLTQAYDRVKSLALEINQMRRKDASLKAMGELESVLSSLPFKLTSSSR